MSRILLIAKRDYRQAVMTKAFLFGLVFMPLLFGGGVFVTTLANRAETKPQRVAIVDRTGVSAATVVQACEEAGLRTGSRFELEVVTPEPREDAQSLTLSNRVHTGELYLFADIPANALSPTPGEMPVIRYYSNATGLTPNALAIPAAINVGLRRVRLAQLGLTPARAAATLREIPAVPMSPVTRDPATGRITQSVDKSRAQSVAVPLFLIILMAMVVMVGSAPNLGAVAEDKAQRVFEMLLVSASPFELMMGKVLAALGAALTSSAFYLAGGVIALKSMSMLSLAPLHMLPWFFVYLIADVTMMAAIGVSLGAACSSAQDAQQLAAVLFLPIFVPMFTLSSVMQHPSGTFATVMSLIPPFTPLLMLLRQALPGAVPAWQPWVGLIGAFAYALFVIWAAARIFRIGILSQGKTPKLRELLQWVVRG